MWTGLNFFSSVFLRYINNRIIKLWTIIAVYGVVSYVNLFLFFTSGYLSPLLSYIEHNKFGKRTPVTINHYMPESSVS